MTLTSPFRSPAAPEGARQEGAASETFPRPTAGGAMDASSLVRSGGLLAKSALVLVCLLTLLTGPQIAGAAEGNLSFEASRLKISYQPRTRSDSSGDRSLRGEIARLNLTLNLINNYLLYLEKLGKIKLEGPLHLEYAPDGADPSQSRGTRYAFLDLGLNAVLTRVNEVLAEQPGTIKRFLLPDRGALSTIQDQHDLRDDPVEGVMGMTNFSVLLPSLSPETDFAILGSGDVVTSRPGELLNELVRLTTNGSSAVLLPSGKRNYGHLLPSSDGTWLACTEGGEPRLLKISSRECKPLFPDAAPRQLLDWAWAPKANRIAGIALDRATLDRRIFIYDADKGQQFPLLDGHPIVDGNYQFAWPCWTQDGQRLLFCSGTELHLVDLEKGKVFPNIVRTPNLISEVMWHPSGRSFAWLEVQGQARSKSDFDNIDYPNSIIHRVFLDDNGQAIDDVRQRHVSSETLKLLGFYDLDRVLFLEGKLHPQRVSSPLWKMEEEFRARLTPPPGNPAANPAPEKTIGGVELPLDYAMVYKTLDTKFKNVYDAGLSTGNQLFVDSMVNTWFIGMRVPTGFPRMQETFCLRPSPYPFPERNRVCFLDLSRDRLMPIVDMLTSYNLRYFSFSADLSSLALLSNSRGPLSLWFAKLADFAGVNLPQPVVSTTQGGEELPTPTIGGTTTEASSSGTSLPAPSLPGSSLPSPSLGAPSLPTPSLPSPTLPGTSGQEPSSLPAPSLPSPTLPSSGKSTSSALPAPSLPAPSLPAPSPANTPSSGKDSSLPAPMLPSPTPPGK